MEIITSRVNSRVKNIINLINKKTERLKQKSFVVEGSKMLNEVRKSKINISTVFLTQRFLNNHKRELNNILNKNIECVLITEDICKKISSNITSQEIFAICKIPKPILFEDVLDYKENILMLLGLQDIGNFGTIIRTANALGIDYILISKDCPDLYNHKVLRATMGVAFNINIIRINDPIEIIKVLKSKGFNSYASVVSDNCEILNNILFKDKNLIIVGNEGNGLSSEIIKNCDKTVKIPMVKGIDSLNVAVATGILLWELKYKAHKKVI